MPLPDLDDGVAFLGAFHPGDAARICEIVADPALRHFGERIAPEPEMAAVEAWLAARIAARQAGLEVAWAVRDACGRLAGWRALTRVDMVERRSDAASWIAADMRGRALSPRSLRLAAAYGFGVLGLRRISIRCDHDNFASMRSIERAGGVYEGLLRNWEDRHGDRIDNHLYALLPEALERPIGGRAAPVEVPAPELLAGAPSLP